MQPSNMLMAALAVLCGCTATPEPGSALRVAGATPLAGASRVQPAGPAVVAGAPVAELRAALPGGTLGFQSAEPRDGVRVRFFIETDGSVSGATVVGSPPPELAAAALEEVRRLQFDPVLRRGRAVRAEAEQVFVFRR
jgi:TonB family protein